MWGEFIMDKDFLLKTYGQCYGEEAGPWNLSVKNKYLQYMFAKFFEENFQIEEGFRICNIGIGAGYWDRYLSYKLSHGELTSIDIDEICCRQLQEALINEGNPHTIKIINSDVTLIDNLDETFDIVTIVGSTRLESGLYQDFLCKVMRFLKKGGSMYYQSLDENENMDDFIKICEENALKIENYFCDLSYGFKAQYWKITK